MMALIAASFLVCQRKRHSNQRDANVARLVPVALRRQVLLKILWLDPYRLV